MNTRSRNLVIAAVVGVVLLAVAAVLLSGGGSGDDDSTTAVGIAQYQAVDVRGAALSEFQSSQNDAAVGKPIPQLIGHEFDGTPVHISADGKPKIILFLSHSCPHCQNEVKALGPWFDDNGLPTGVEFFAVSTNASDQLPNWPPSAWLENWKSQVLVDDKAQTAAKAFGLPAFPYWVVVGADGNVAGRLTGEVGVAGVQEMIKSVTSGS